MKLSSLILAAAAAAAVLCCMVALSTACNGVSAPEIALSQLHGGCYTDGRSRHPDCVAAMHRYCNMVTYPTPRHSIGVSREHINLRTGLSCIRAHWYGDVTISHLRQFHGGCHLGASQGRDCLSAIHRYCMSRFGQDFAGTSQEVGSNVFGVGCFRTTRKDSVSVHVLTHLHGGCTFPRSDSNSCYAAASRYCSQYFGHTGGITQEVGGGHMTVACYDASYSGDAFHVRNHDFYAARNQAREVCGLNFNIPAGQVLNSPEVLWMESYDNSQSDTELLSTFSFTQSVTETSRFEFSTSVTISADISFSIGIPVVASGSLSLSASITDSFRNSQETSRTKTYTHTSEVRVPPFTRIMKEAAITRASLAVPWTATVRNGLGTVVHISGTWYGVDTFDLRITQRNY